MRVDYFIKHCEKFLKTEVSANDAAKLISEAVIQLQKLRIEVFTLQSFIARSKKFEKAPIELMNDFFDDVKKNSVYELQFAGQELNVQDNLRALIIKALTIANGNRGRAAKALGIGERTLYRRLSGLKINVE